MDALASALYQTGSIGLFSSMTVNTHRLVRVGPRDPGHGYPLWYADEDGTRLMLGLGPDPLLPAIGEIPQPGAPLLIPGNFPDESFYFAAEAELSVGGAGVTGRGRLVLALEAAFGGPGEPAADARVVFARLRVRMDDLIPGAAYVVTHPYGVTDPLVADDRGRVFWTDDRGVADEEFQAVVDQGQVAPFLRWTSGAAMAPGELEAPAGYLGDGVTAHTITGSPFGTNIFRVDGPDVAAGGGPRDPADPTNADRVQTDRFSVQGKEATVFGVTPTRAVYTRAGSPIMLDVFADTLSGASIELGGVGVPRVALAAEGESYAARVAVPAVPAEVEVLNVSDQPITRVTTALTDQVSVLRADLDLSLGTLTVEAASSDDQVTAFDVLGLGPLTPGAPASRVFSVAAAPARVTVRSSAGGSTTAAVMVTGPALPVLPGVLAAAGPDVTAVVGSAVALDGTGSRGDVAGYAWAITAGAGTLADTTTATPTYTAPAAPSTATVELIVTGADASTSTDSLVVSVVAAPPPDVLLVDRAEFRTDKQQYRVSGTVTGALPDTVSVAVHGVEIGSSPVDITGAWDVRRTLLPSESALRPVVGDTAAVTSTGGGAAAPVVRIRN